MKASRNILYLTFALFSGLSFADGNENTKGKVLLSWETPEEGSAVNFNNEKDYLRQPPLLKSSRRQDNIIKLEMNIAPTLQKLILPGKESSFDNHEEENYLNNLGARAAQKALDFLENKVSTVNVNGQNLNIETDCSFFVRAAYWEASDHTVDLFRESLATNSVNPNGATGVTLIAEYLKKNKRYQPRNPKIGDIIIFDNTYDKNHNQQRDDVYTHTGIVTGIRADNTIEFVHGNIGRTIKKGFINFNHMDSAQFENHPVNSYIRPHYSWEKNPSLSLASHLVRAFGGL